MERYWEKISPEILCKWDRLSKYDLEGVSGDFDGLVEVIRKRYSPLKSKLSIEAEIRDWLACRITEMEKEGS
jgi:hypothetical protein